jgi:hypothetical protein
MGRKKVSQEDFDNVQSGYHACPYNVTFRVGSEYKIANPSDKTEIITVRCTQSSPHAIIKV